MIRTTVVNKLKELLRPVYWGVRSKYRESKRGLRMSPLYADHMILQCGTPLKVAGHSYPADWVTVRIGEQEQQTCCDSEGRWEVLLDAFQPGGPYTLEVSTPQRQLCYTDVYAGEVWLCSGQSNMVLSLSYHLYRCPEERIAAMDRESAVPFRKYIISSIWPTYPGKWSLLVGYCVNRYWYARFGSWQNCHGSALDNLPAVAYYYGEMLSRKLQVPVGLIANPVGGTAEYCWIERRVLQRELPEILHQWYENVKVTAWMKERVIHNLGKQMPEYEQLHPYHPGYCYETFIRPIKGYAIKGVIWFAGESSAQLGDMALFEKMQLLLVKNWRESWGECFPFYYTQLHGCCYEETFGKGCSYYYPQLRECQRGLLEKIPYSGMAVAYDLSIPNKVHFLRRKPLGERLARLALHHTYGWHDMVPCGPLFHEALLRENLIYIRFDFAAGLHTSDGESVHTFEVAGADRCFYPAEAGIEECEVVLSCPAVSSPLWVHYAFDAYPRQANLVNGEELPAAAFEIKVPIPAYLPGLARRGLNFLCINKLRIT